MIEKLVTSKTRAKLLKHFITHIDHRYYLRELERLLEESLSPMRRQILKLVEMGILLVEDEGNIKYYRLNKNFEGLEELKNLILGKEEPLKVESYTVSKTIAHSVTSDKGQETRETIQVTSDKGQETGEKIPVPAKRVRTDLILLTVISIFVLTSAIFIVYLNSKNMKEVANIISVEKEKETADIKEAVNIILSEKEKDTAKNYKRAKATRPDQMTSRKWKLTSGSMPALASGAAGGGGQEL